MKEECACCGIRDADAKFPLSKAASNIAGWPIARACLEEYGAAALAKRIWSRANSLNPEDPLFKGHVE